MLHPIGSRPPAVYWRRRLVMFGALLVMIVLTVWVLRPNGDKGSAASTPSPNRTSSVSAPSTPAPSQSSHSSGASTPVRTSPSAGPPRCVATALKVAAVVGQPSYRVGEKPTVLLQVTNVGSAPCVQNLADSQVELRVYNGESRVWGSHDCTVEPGVADRTLAVGRPVRVSVIWSGLSSQPRCAGTRQRVGAGAYTLYALLSGHQGSAAQFSIS